MIEFLIGVSLALSTIFVSRSMNVRNWLYTAFLLSLPAIYMAFGLFSGTSGVILNEFIYGIPYFIIAIICLKFNFKYATYIVSLLWLAHGAYDLWHSQLFINSGVPSWYPLFCLAVDIVIGGYLLLLALNSGRTNIKVSASNA